jgi:phage tail-like protein
MANYPVPVFHFKVTIDSLPPMTFSEVSGLTQERQAIEYRDGSMKPTDLPLRRPGLAKASNVTMKRGITKSNEFYVWFNNADIQRKNVNIQLLNDVGDPVMVWDLINAWPIKLEGPSLKATGNDIAIESMELVHEGITVKLV